MGIKHQTTIIHHTVTQRFTNQYFQTSPVHRIIAAEGQAYFSVIHTEWKQWKAVICTLIKQHSLAESLPALKYLGLKPSSDDCSGVRKIITVELVMKKSTKSTNRTLLYEGWSWMEGSFTMIQDKGRVFTMWSKDVQSTLTRLVFQDGSTDLLLLFTNLDAKCK